MNIYFKTDAPRVQMYMNENADWQITLSSKNKEIPKLEKMLSDSLRMGALPEEKETGANSYFRQQLLLQKMQLEELNLELDMQQLRLEHDSRSDSQYDVHALCNQDILRDRIKEVEKGFVDLKCNFMKYLSSVL